MAQSVKFQSLDLSSGLDLRFMSSSPMLGTELGGEPTWGGGKNGLKKDKTFDSVWIMKEEQEYSWQVRDKNVWVEKRS